MGSDAEYRLAIDVGASSGRHIVGWKENGLLLTKEVYRFPNAMKKCGGHLVWDVQSLLGEIKTGIGIAKERFGRIASLSVDTWGVDYVLLRGDAEAASCYAYRDERNIAAAKAVHEVIPFEELYSRTGSQFQPFNSIYQLYADKLSGRLTGVTDFLMMPEYLLWKLCGRRVKEYTVATTTGLINAKTGRFDGEIIKELGLPGQLFRETAEPGTAIGEYDGIKVVLCATHDTASAVEGIPMPDDSIYLSSGTWSLLGVKLPAPLADKNSRESNFTNEGGVGYIRYLKNIMGMWIIQRLREQMGGIDFSKMAELASESGCDLVFDVDDPRFSNPQDMRAETLAALGGAAVSDGDLISSVYHSLAFNYGRTVRQLERNTGKSWDRIYIAGGGAKNNYLNGLTERYTGKKVIALPIEATALGNLKIQMDNN